MKKTEAVRTAVKAALKRGNASLRRFERDLGVMLPPVSYTCETQAALREHYFALRHAERDAELWSGILQHFLQRHFIPVPSGVFKRRMYDPLTSTVFSPDGVPRPLIPTKTGRPSKADQAFELMLQWFGAGCPSFGQFFIALNPGKKMLPHEIKRGADRIRQQIRSVSPSREKKRK